MAGLLSALWRVKGPTAEDATVADEAIESEVRQWLRDHQGHAHCARGIARDLHQEPRLIQAAMDVLATRQIFSAGPCACGRGGLSYGWSVGLRG
jgi:hypothetical protein